MKPIIFIVGAGRSGTSLVQSILASHSKMGSPPETSFVRRFIVARGPARPNETMDRDRIEALLSQDRFLSRLNMDWPVILSRLPEYNGPSWKVDLYHILMTEYLKGLGKRRLIDKDPRLVEFLPTIKRWWPEASIIHVIRDPRDVLVSKKKAAWSKDRPVWLHIFANLVQFKMGRRLGPRLFGDNYIEIAYEELVKSPDGAIRDVCNRLRETFEPAMLDYATTAGRLATPEEIPWKKETLGPIISNNHRKWPGTLSRWEISLTETACREGIEACGLGFSPVDGLGGLKGILFHLIGKIMRVFGFFYIQFRLWTQN